MPHTHKTSFKEPYLNCSIDCGNGRATIPCSLLEISESQAVIELSTPTEVPDQFVLLLTKNGHVARKCKIVQRSNLKIIARILALISAANPVNDAVLVN